MANASTSNLLSPDALQGYVEMIVDMAVAWAPKLLMALAVLIIGWWIIKRIVRALGAAIEKRGSDVTLARFLTSLTGIVLKAVLLISVASMVGIETTSFVAILGAAGLAVGLALQGSLSNFAGGVLILLFRPFKVGDVIEAQGVVGSVSSIQIFNTIMKTPDNKTIIVPNGPLSNDIITNYSTEDTRRVDFVFGIGYEDNINQAKEHLLAIFEADERVMSDPAPFVAVSELADSSVNFTCRVWVESANYWPVYFDTHHTVKENFDSANISIPYPQTDVHLHQVQ